MLILQLYELFGTDNIYLKMDNYWLLVKKDTRISDERKLEVFYDLSAISLTPFSSSWVRPRQLKIRLKPQEYTSSKSRRQLCKLLKRPRCAKFAVKN